MDGQARIPRRRLDLDFDPKIVPRDFYAGDEILTLMMCSLSVVFPEGERFFVESVVRYRDAIADPELLEDVRGFASQEGMHSKEHMAVNTMLVAQGLASAGELEAQVKWLLRRVRRLRTPQEQLAITCALEHITAIMGEQLLTNERYRHEERARSRKLSCARAHALGDASKMAP